MKKIITIVFLLLFLATPVLAEENPSITPDPSINPTPVGYTLPYPGLMPGNPLYIFKAARDKLTEFFITDPLKKSKFLLLQADKHLQAGAMLWDKKNFSQSEQTISKGENYLDLAVGKEVSAKEAGEATDEVLGQLFLSSLKHQEVIKKLEESAPSQVLNQLQSDFKKASEIEKRVKQLQSQQ